MLTRVADCRGNTHNHQRRLAIRIHHSAGGGSEHAGHVRVVSGCVCVCVYACVYACAVCICQSGESARSAQRRTMFVTSAAAAQVLLHHPNRRYTAVRV